MQRAQLAARETASSMKTILARRKLHCSRTSHAQASTSTASTSKQSLASKPFRLAVVGSGPAGFYATSRILAMAGSENTAVDMFEELPVPFGLVRYGVAPDHPEVKNCIHKFEEVAAHKRFRYFGNVQIGGPSYPTPPSSPASFQSPHASNRETRHALSIPLAFLRPHYHAILFTYGASDDRGLGAAVHNDEADLDNVMTARSFVHWYNGHPHSPLHCGSQRIDLSVLKKADIIGQGNVALDCARILLSGGHSNEMGRLAKTDTPESVLAELSRSRVNEVDIVGRRGPLQFAGTTKEVRELVTLGSDVDFYLPADDSAAIASSLREIKAYEDAGGLIENARMKKRLLGLMQKGKTSTERPADARKAWSLKFCRSPVGLYAADGGSTGPVKTVKYELNDLQPVSTSTLPSGQGVDPSNLGARGTGQTVEVETDLLLKSVGYRSVGIDGLPFDGRKGIARNVDGRLVEADGTQLPGLYVSGWLARGPNGVIATTMYNAFETADLIASDFASSDHPQQLPDLPDLQSAGFGNQKVVSWEDWKAIDSEERRRGEKLGKEREKLVTVEAMLGVLG